MASAIARFFKHRVGQIREASNKANTAELKLFLELGHLDLRPIPPEKSIEDILLFFKLYDPYTAGQLF
ncbi:Ubiquitin C-terminal hydrolase 12 [Cardamine amara subsp. amara]|uniref:Ubiquitin C-terminal hydrolase 12 n=1 Tax=Cardamine amara subsp. amara TaxID=228776 RepID=A0ABD1ANG2_CARAN